MSQNLRTIDIFVC